MGLIFKAIVVLVFFVGCKDSTQKGMEYFSQGDFKQATFFLQESCIQGSLKSCLLTASAYVKDNSKEARTKALKALNYACEYGDSFSCQVVFKAYQRSGLSKQALKALQNGCQSGEALLCYEWGKRYFQGRWVEKNEKRALELWIKSCYGGLKKGCEVAIVWLEKHNSQDFQIDKLKELL